MSGLLDAVISNVIEDLLRNPPRPTPYQPQRLVLVKETGRFLVVISENGQEQHWPKRKLSWESARKK